MRSDLKSAGIWLAMWLFGLGFLAVTPCVAAHPSDSGAATVYYGYGAGNTVYQDAAGGYTVTVRGLRPVSGD